VKSLFIFVLLSMQLSLSVVTAQTVIGLYSARLPISSQSETARNRMISELFARVLVKVSGSTAVLNNQLIKSRLGDAISYTAEFNFATDADGLNLTARFNEELVDDLLTSAGLSIWGTRRPTVVVWLAYQGNNFQRKVLTEQSRNDYSRVISTRARYRGLPVLVPLWDLDDRLQVDTTDVWGLFSDKIAVASQRYRADFMIIGKVFQQGNKTNIKWVIHKSPTSVTAGDVQTSRIISQGSGEFNNANNALKALVDQSSNFFARQYGVSTTAQVQGIPFKVSNIDSIETYAAVTKYLMSLKIVKSLQVTNVVDDDFTFELNIFGGASSLLDVINLDKKLLQDATLLGNESRSFHWVQ
jgi:hypothetical protein